MTWRRIPPPSTFEKARRREAYRRLARMVTGGARDDLLPLEEVQRRLRAFEQSYEGVRPVPIDKIVGTSDRSRDFDKDFLPRTEESRRRWKGVERSYPEGDFPPIVVYELQGTYYVVDGHHRVAVAKQMGVETIDAEVTKLQPRYAVPEGADIGAIIRAEQRALFMEESGLGSARPDALIEFTDPMGYPELFELMKAHGYHVMHDRNEVVPLEEIAADWYDWIYAPTVEAIRSEGLTQYFEGSTEADLFLWIWQRRRALFPEHGGMSIEDAIQHVRETEGKKRKPRRGPGILRGGPDE
ncbi:MAG: ParB/RepB/Spo0J family partition protein [Actinomycetota bacterium]